MRLPQLNRRNYPIPIEQRLIAPITESASGTASIGYEEMNLPISAWVEKFYSAIQNELSEDQIKDREMKSRIVIPFQQFFKKYIHNIRQNGARTTHYQAIRSMFQEIKGYDDTEMARKFVTYEDYAKTITNKVLILPSLTSQEIYQKNTKFVSQTFEMFCTVIADPKTIMISSKKPQGKFRLTNDNFDHEGYAFFRECQGQMPFMFAFAERRAVESSFIKGASLNTPYKNGDNSLIFQHGFKIIDPDIKSYILEEGQLVVRGVKVEEWKKNKAKKDEIRRKATESRLQPNQLRGIAGRSEFRYNDSTNDTST